MEDHQHTFVRQHRESGYVLACIHPGCEEVRPELPTLDPIMEQQEQEQEQQEVLNGAEQLRHDEQSKEGEQRADDQQSQETGDGTGGQAEGAPETQTKKVVKARAEKV